MMWGLRPRKTLFRVWIVDIYRVIGRDFFCLKFFVW